MAIYDIDGNQLNSDLLFVNVKDFGAKGDSITDDSTSIQSALDSARSGGGIIFFPKGVYLIKTGVLFYSEQTLLFENGAVLKQGAAITNLLMTYCGSSTGGYDGTHDCVIIGAVFDGGSYTTNNTLVGVIHSKNITFKNCTFKNAYGRWHNIEINASYNVKLINCDLEGSRKNDTRGELIQIDAITNSDTWPWPDNIGLIDSTVCKYIEVSGCILHDSVATAIGNHSGVINKFIDIHDCVFDSITSTRGAICLQSSTNVRVMSNSFSSCTTGLTQDTSSTLIIGNSFADVTTVNAGSGNAHHNIINGTYTA